MLTKRYSKTAIILSIIFSIWVSVGCATSSTQTNTSQNIDLPTQEPTQASVDESIDEQESQTPEVKTPNTAEPDTNTEQDGISVTATAKTSCPEDAFIALAAAPSLSIPDPICMWENGTIHVGNNQSFMVDPLEIERLHRDIDSKLSTTRIANTSSLISLGICESCTEIKLPDSLDKSTVNRFIIGKDVELAESNYNDPNRIDRINAEGTYVMNRILNMVDHATSKEPVLWISITWPEEDNLEPFQIHSDLSIIISGESQNSLDLGIARSYVDYLNGIQMRYDDVTLGELEGCRSCMEITFLSYMTRDYETIHLDPNSEAHAHNFVHLYVDFHQLLNQVTKN